jgi:AmmeMemoRadiSam system protein B/AmmeMemoRadiSam system protein A
MKMKVTMAIILVICAAATVLMGSMQSVKEPSVAGAFYPGDRTVLTRAVETYLKAAKATAPTGRLIALIAPHAGYEYSGQVAAYAYKHIAEREIDTVILIGPAHHAALQGASVYNEGSLRTPLGLVKVNEKIAKALLNEKARVTFDRAAYTREHSLEVQLPFLQKTVKNFTIVPILIGMPTREMYAHLEAKLAAVLRENERAIIVASTDLSHYHDAATAVALDKKTIDAVQRMSIEDLQNCLASGKGEMCGGSPVLLTMAVARKLGATNGVLFRYANSGDVTGDTGSVVGYAAMGLYASTLTAPQQQELLALAKKTIIQYVKQGTTPADIPADPRLQANGATFVTINKHGNLRGCIGNIEPIMPLYRSVVQNAVSAATRDPRFPPLRVDELMDLEVEVSVLSPLVELREVRDIRIGTHGLLLVHKAGSGLLLPQVPVEFGWDVPTFLKQLSQKAGLPENAWKEGTLYGFTADVIR